MSRKFMFLALVVVLALGGLGVAYGAWTKTLTINGTAQTATFVVTTAATKVDGGENCTATGSDTATAASWTLNLLNAVPGDTCVVNLSATNSGSIPVNIIPGTVGLPNDHAYFDFATTCTTAMAGSLAVNETRTCSVSATVKDNAPMTPAGNVPFSVSLQFHQ